MLITIAITLAVAWLALPALASTGTIGLVQGQVTDANGQAVAGAEVHLLNDIYREIAVTTTDANGSFNFTSPVATTPTIKVRVTYNVSGKEYATQLQNTNWYSTGNGSVSISLNDSRLEDYPEPDTGFIWGVIYDANNTPITGTIYVSDGVKTLTFETSNPAHPEFIAQVMVGNYSVFAIHTDANGSKKSKSSSVQVTPARARENTSPAVLVADQPVTTEELALLMATPTPQPTLLPTAFSTAVPTQQATSTPAAPSPFGSLITPILALVIVGIVIVVASYLKK